MSSMLSIAADDGEVIEQLAFLCNALADRQGAMDEDEAHGLSRMLGHIIQDLTPNRES